MTFDTDAFLRDNFQNPGKLSAFLRAYGAENTPPQPTLEKWFQRKSVPSDWLPVLLALLEIEQGVPLSLRHYL